MARAPATREPPPLSLLPTVAFFPPGRSRPPTGGRSVALSSRRAAVVGVAWPVGEAGARPRGAAAAGAACPPACAERGSEKRERHRWRARGRVCAVLEACVDARVSGWRWREGAVAGLFRRSGPAAPRFPWPCGVLPPLPAPPPLRERLRAARGREGWSGPVPRLSPSPSFLARGCPLRRRPAGRRGVRAPTRAPPGCGRCVGWKASRHVG